MPQELIQILTNLPVVVLFMWWVDRSNRSFMEFLREERKARQDDQVVERKARQDEAAAERAARQKEIEMLATQLRGVDGKVDKLLYGRRRTDRTKSEE